MVDPSKVYLDNGMCPFRRKPTDPPHKCDIHKNPPSKYTEGFDTGYWCNHGEWNSKSPAPCDTNHPKYNTRVWESSSEKPMPRYDGKTGKWIGPKKPQRFIPKPNSDGMVRGIMSMLPPIDYLGDKLYDLRKIDRLDEYDYRLPNDEARKKYFEEHREEAEKLLRKKRCSCKPKRKTCRCKK